MMFKQYVRRLIGGARFAPVVFLLVGFMPVGLVLTGTTLFEISQAQAYEQNVTCERGRNRCGPDDQAKPIVWDRSCVLFYMDEGGSDDFGLGPDGKASPALEQIVKKSFGAWSAPECSGLSLIYGGMRDPADHQVGERRNVVTFEQEGWSQTSAMTFATTMVNYHPRTGVIREADIKVNDQFYRFTTHASPQPGEADLQNTLTHEVGHFLGMAHSSVADATMHGAAALGETKKRTLHRDDIEGLCAYYPASQYTGTCGQDDDPGDDDGSDSLDWGADADSSASEATCDVTGPGGSAMMSPMMLIVGLFGGVLWRRRSRRSSDG
jgi:hypothetical protein